MRLRKLFQSKNTVWQFAAKALNRERTLKNANLKLASMRGD